MLPNIMKGLVLLILASVSSGVKYDGLRVKFSMNPDHTGVKNFHNIPRTVEQAVSEGWSLTERPPGRLSDLKMYCYKNYIVCALYGPAKFIVGLQVAFPVNTVKPELKPERYFIKWCPPAVDGRPQQEFWTATQYYASEDFIKAGGPTAENGATLQDGGVYFNDLDGNLMKITLDENEIKPPYKKQLCLPAMGVHYYYNVSREFDCSTIFLPFYGLFTDGKLAGVGFQTYATHPVVAEGERDWFEILPRGRNATKLTMPDASDCILDNNVKYSTDSLHIYYMNEPWIMKCDKERISSYT